MRLTTILLTAIVALLASFAAVGETVGTLGRVYKCNDGHFVLQYKRETLTDNYDVRIAGHEIVNGRLMTRVDVDNPENRCRRYFYREGKKIYEYLKDERNSILIFNYEARVGDRDFSDLNYDGSFLINHIDTISVDGREYRRFFYSRGNALLAMPWVEGIGPLTTYPLENTKNPSSVVNSWQPHVSSVYDEDKCIFTFQDFLFSPLPWEGGAGVEEIEVEETMEDSRMFDLMGREIRSPLPGTVYIRNGKKFIAR